MPAGGASLDGSLEWKLLEHSKVCPVMRLFSGCRADAEIQSVLFMCLDAFATHQASGHDLQQHPTLTALGLKKLPEASIAGQAEPSS